MFLMSTLYHAFQNRKAKTVMKKLDHIAIFLLITGTYTPFVFVLNTIWGYFCYLILIIISICGIVLKVFTAGQYKKLTTLLYLILGWMAILIVPALYLHVIIPRISLILILLGGLLYTIGSLFYMFSKFKYHHAVWHIFVFFAVIIQYYGILYLIDK